MNAFTLFEKLNKVIEDENIQVLKLHTRRIEEAIHSGHAIDIAVLGEFKVGKSSFINSFIGKDILPTGVIPITSVITRIGPGEEEKAIVYFENGNTKEIAFGDIDLFVNESANPHNVKKVETLKVQLTNLDFPVGLHIVDTPGLGSFWKHNTETAKQWYGHVGIAVITISPERPVSENEINLIREIIDETPEVVILLTKTDLFAESEIQKIETYIHETLQLEFKTNFRVFRYSLKTQTEEFKNILIDSVIKPLDREFDLKQEKILGHKIQSLFRQCMAYLDIARISSLHSEKEREKLKKEIFDSRINQSFVAKEMALVLTDELDGIRDKILGFLLPEQPQIEKRLKNKFKKDSVSWKGNLNKRTGIFEQWMKKELAMEMMEVAEKHHSKFNSIIEETSGHFAFFASTFRNGLKTRIKEVLDTDMPLEDLDIHYDKLEKPDILVSWTFESHIDLLWFLFPMAIFSKVLNNYFERRISSEIQINIYRLSSSLTGMLSKSIKAIKEQAHGYMTSELLTIESILNKPGSKSIQYEKIIGDLQRLNHDGNPIKSS